MTDRDLDRIRFVTRHFNDLQGLRLLVPLGLLQIASGMTGGFAKVTRLLPWTLALQVAAAAVALFLMLRAGSHYRSYGHVEPQRRSPCRYWGWRLSAPRCSSSRRPWSSRMSCWRWPTRGSPRSFKALPC
jgi:hypothetical protein